MADELKQAARLRGGIKRIVRAELRKHAPPTRVGTVQTINRDQNYCTVLFPGDSTALKVDITYGNQPRYARFDDNGVDTGGGDLVRIGGRPGAYYLMDVLTSSGVNQHIETTLGDLSSTVDDITAVNPPVPPTVSNTPTVVGGATSLLVSFPPSTETYNLVADVYVSTAAAYTPDITTYVKTTSGTSTVIDKLADGSKLLAGVTYYVIVVFRQGTVSAPPSAPGAGVLGGIGVDQLLAGTLTATTILGTGAGIIAQGLAGEEVAMRPTGFTVKGPTALGNPEYVSFPTSGAPNIISGVLKATTLEVQGDPTTLSAMTLFNNSELSAGAMLKIASILAPPPAAPQVASTYSEQYNLTDTGGQTFYGVYTHGGYYDATTSRVVTISDDSDRIVEISIADGQIKASHSVASFWPEAANWYGITKIGTVIYVLYSYNIMGGGVGYRIGRIDSTTWTKLANGVSISSSQAAPMAIPGVNAIAIGNDGTNILIAYSPSTGGNGVIKTTSDLINFATGLVTYNLSTSVAGVNTVMKGNFDFGSARFIVASPSLAMSFTTAAAPVYNNNEIWAPIDSFASGTYWDGTYFRGLSKNNIIARHSKINWTDDTLTYRYTWITTTKYSGGTLETPMSPAMRVQVLKRGGIKVTGSFPGATGMRIYSAKEVAVNVQPANSAFQRNGEVTGITTGTAALQLDATDWTTPGTLVAPTVSGFGAAPAGIVSTDGGSFWYGDNTAQFQQLVLVSTVDANANAGNKPALRVGAVTGRHVRVDGNQVQAMLSDTAVGTYYIQTELDASGTRGSTQIGEGSNSIKQIRFNSQLITTDANGEAVINHGLSGNPDFCGAFSRTSVVNVTVAVVTETATQLTLRVTRVSDGAVQAGLTRQISWIAIRF